MAKVYNYITIDYTKDVYTPSIDVVQGDTGRGIIFDIRSPITNLETDLENLTATLNVEKPNGETTSTTGTITLVGSDTAKVTIEPSSSYARIINVSGVAKGTLVIATATQTITSFKVKLNIKENPFYVPSTNVRKFDVTKVSKIDGVMQYEHNVQSIQFVGLNYTGDVYIRVSNTGFDADAEIEGYDNTIPLTDYTFVLAQPMTRYDGIFYCQLFGDTTSNGETTKFELTPVFQIEITKSLPQGEEIQYPVDPTIAYGIDEYVAQKEADIDAYVDNVIDSIPSDYTTLESQIQDLLAIGFEIVVDENGNAEIMRSDLTNTEEVSY